MATLKNIYILNSFAVPSCIFACEKQACPIGQPVRP
jgi:hypothetical protein